MSIDVDQCGCCKGLECHIKCSYLLIVEGPSMKKCLSLKFLEKKIPKLFKNKKKSAKKW